MEAARILIAGAGIGGLTAAAALTRAGFAVTVCERAAEIRPVGAGLSLQPNAVAALRTLGLADRIVAAGERSGPAAILEPSGRVISRMDISAFWREEVGVTVHRATLHRLLLAAAGDARVELGAAVAGVETVAAGVRLHLEDGRRIEGDLLIGADGIRSAVRRHLLADGEPLYAGYFCWRGVCPALPQPLAGLSETWGRGQRFGLVPIDGGRIYWFAVVNGPPGGVDRPGEVKSHLEKRFAGWHEPIAAVLAATPEAAIVRGDILYRKPAATWGRGNITLLGDAAHPMTPDFGQGACQAIEDAVVLAAVLAEAPPKQLAAALRRYEKLRQPRTAAIVRNAARFGGMAQWQNPMLCSVRNWLNAKIPQKTLEKEVSRLWRFPGPSPQKTRDRPVMG